MLLNNELNLTYPDSFRILSEDETAKMNFIEKGAGICLSDDAAHIKMTVGWKEIGLFAGFLLNVRDISAKMKDSIQKNMSKYDYRSEKTFEKNIGGLKAEGVSYFYTVGQVEMYGESDVVKHGNTVYYFNFYSRASQLDENLKVWDGILASAGWNR